MIDVQCGSSGGSAIKHIDAVQASRSNGMCSEAVVTYRTILGKNAAKGASATKVSGVQRAKVSGKRGERKVISFDGGYINVIRHFETGEWCIGSFDNAYVYNVECVGQFVNK